MLLFFAFQKTEACVFSIVSIFIFKPSYQGKFFKRIVRRYMTGSLKSK